MSVYNGIPYLIEAVESILKQTFKDFEFIIVDDASEDGTWKYLKSLKDNRVKLIKNKRNNGLAASLNRALKVSKGDYIARMDADDISLPRRLEIQSVFLRENPKVDICGSWVKLIDDKNEIIGQIHKPVSEKEIKKMNRWIPGIIHPTWLSRKNVFFKLNGYDPDYDMVEDYEFLIRARNFHMANINKELLLWRSSDNRRSKDKVNDMYKKSLQVRWHYFKDGTFSLSFFPLLLRSFITTYFFPTKLKVILNKKLL